MYSVAALVPDLRTPFAGPRPPPAAAVTAR